MDKVTTFPGSRSGPARRRDEPAEIVILPTVPVVSYGEVAEAVRLRAPEFADVVEALRWWRARDDRLPLRAATAPPVDVTGDAVSDVILAIVFRDVVGIESRVAQIGRIQVTIDIHRRQSDDLLAQDDGSDVDAVTRTIDAVRQLGRLVRVLERWKTEIMESD